MEHTSSPMHRHGSGQVQAVRSNVVSHCHPNVYTGNVSDKLHQANISVSHAGGAAAAYPAFSSVPDLNEIQSPITGMKPMLDQTSNSPFSTSGTILYDNSPLYDPTVAGDHSYRTELGNCFTSPSSNQNSFLDGQLVNILGETSQQDLDIDVDTDPPTAPPWTHLLATQGRIPPFPQNLLPSSADNSQRESNPKRPRTRSPGSGRGSFRDSAYSTLRREARHENETMLDLPSSAFNNVNMDQETMSLQSLQQTQFPLPEYLPPSQQGDFSHYPMQLSPQQYLNQSPTAPRRVSQPQQRGQGTSSTKSLSCEDCDYLAKSRSDLNKHNARHTKKFKCHFSDCAQQRKGFPTSNDLDRHLKSVHNINNRRTKDYKCFAKDCTKPDKTWPRLDNFKQHLKSMHKNQDHAELLKKSEQWYDSQNITQSQHNDETESNYEQSHTSLGDFGEMDHNSLMQFQPALFNQYQERVDPSLQRMINSQLDIMLHSPIDPRLQTPNARLQGTRRLNSGFPTPRSQFQRSHNRRASSPEPSSVRLQQRSVPFPINTNSMISQATMMQRTLSQTSHPQTRSAFPNPDTHNQFPTFPQLSDYPWALHAGALQSRGNQNLELPQTREQKRPHTTPDPNLDPNRMMTDFTSSPLETQSALDQGINNDELLGNMGWSANVGELQATAQHPALIVHPPTDEPNSRKSTLQEVVEEEIHNFLQQYKDQERALLQEDIVRLFRLSLRNSLDTITNADSSVRSMIGAANDSEQPLTAEGKKPPPDKDGHFPCTFKGCSKVSKKLSGLKKHLQRHKKPFGCTFDGCSKVFGSKNDWKRHEQSQHEQPECWRCHKCYEVFFHEQNNFINHLMNEHGVRRTDEATKQAKSRRIARNNQGQFWCGFCNKIIFHDRSGVEAVNHRFDHIAVHFKNEKSSGDWVELRGCGKTKAALREESRVHSPTNTEDDEEDEGDNSEQQHTQVMSGNSIINSIPSGAPMPSDSSTGRQSLSQYSSSNAEMNFGTVNHNMRLDQSDVNLQWGQQLSLGQETMSTQTQPRRAPAEYVICCQCNHPYNFAVSNSCVDCDHLAKGCPGCTLGIPNPKVTT